MDLVQVDPSQLLAAEVRRHTCVRRRHKIWEWRGAWLCRKCGKSFGATCSPQHLEKAPCKGAMQSRLLASMGVELPQGDWDCFNPQELIGQGGRKWSNTDRGAGCGGHCSPAECNGAQATGGHAA